MDIAVMADSLQARGRVCHASEISPAAVKHPASLAFFRKTLLDQIQLVEVQSSLPPPLWASDRSMLSICAGRAPES